MSYFIHSFFISMNQLLLSRLLICNCLSANFHSVEFLCALVILPNIVKTLVCISASRGNSPDSIYTAGSATFIVGP
jgi:hypothetical protein